MAFPSPPRPPAGLDAETVRAWDREDPLAPFRARFLVDDPDLVYLDGNSLGRLPLRAVERAERVVREEWGGRLIRGWNEGWWDLPSRVGRGLAEVLGAREGEVVCADSTSVNLFKLALAALRARPGRTRILTDTLVFPSDLYILRSVASLSGPDCEVVQVPSPDGIRVPFESLESALDRRTALLCLCHTAFQSGFTYDLEQVTALAHRAGALVLWDLCHSAGVMPVELSAAGADLAVGCTYKYLNGGPGAPAFLYVRSDLQHDLRNPLTGWFGHEDPFRFSPEYSPRLDARGYLTGTPPIVSLALVEPGVELVREAGVAAIRAKSLRQTELLLALFDSRLAGLGFELGTPRGAAERGSHVALRHPQAARLSRALTAMGVVPDFRPPDTLRLGVSPLYTTYEEVYRGVLALERAARERLYEAFPESGAVVP